jgi:hypothetical protein
MFRAIKMAGLGSAGRPECGPFLLSACVAASIREVSCDRQQGPGGGGEEKKQKKIKEEKGKRCGLQGRGKGPLIRWA